MTFLTFAGSGAGSWLRALPPTGCFSGLTGSMRPALA